MRRWTCPPLLAGAALLGFALAAAAWPSEAATAAQRYHESIPGTLVTFEMIQVPAGPISIDGEAGPTTVEVETFFIGRTEVTWDMYDVFALGLNTPSGGDADSVARPSSPYGAPDRGWGHAGYPVMSVTRTAAEAFCAWLTAATGRTYRLPTDAEWSRAAVLAAEGTTLSDEQREALAWHRDNAETQTRPVGTRQPDDLGLYDLFGNAAEWVMTTSGALATRGGSYRDEPASVGPGARAVQDSSWNETDPQLPKSRWWLSDGPFVGFRLVAEATGAHR